MAPTESLKNPGLHSAADDAPAEATYEPFGEVVHAVDPGCALKDPGKQGVATTAPDPLT